MDKLIKEPMTEEKKKTITKIAIGVGIGILVLILLILLIYWIAKNKASGTTGYHNAIPITNDYL